jgi:hypothetical protein
MLSLHCIRASQPISPIPHLVRLTSRFQVARPDTKAMMVGSSLPAAHSKWSSCNGPTGEPGQRVQGPYIILQRHLSLRRFDTLSFLWFCGPDSGWLNIVLALASDKCNSPSAFAILVLADLLMYMCTAEVPAHQGSHMTDPRN